MRLTSRACRTDVLRAGWSAVMPRQAIDAAIVYGEVDDLLSLPTRSRAAYYLLFMALFEKIPSRRRRIATPDASAI